MLTQLSIRDYAIVESLELEFGPGMTTVTGETGAGKSIMVDALGLLLGDRSDAAAVRTGTERAEIAARFDVERLPGAQDWLAERELDLETHECVLRRTIGRDGRSRAWINGSPLPLASLRELGERLVDIHGQHEHQSLMQRDAQRALLDEYAGLKDELTALGAAFQHWARLRRRIDELEQRSSERDARLDMLRYQVRELEDLALGANELPQLEEEHARLANAGRLLDTCRQVLDAVYEGEPVSAQGLLGSAAATFVTAARWKLLSEMMGGSHLPYGIYFYYLALTRVIGQILPTVLVDVLGRGAALRAAGSDSRLGQLIAPVVLERLLDLLLPLTLQIGRASCRERVSSPV